MSHLCLYAVDPVLEHRVTLGMRVSLFDADTNRKVAGDVRELLQNFYIPNLEYSEQLLERGDGCIPGGPLLVARKAVPEDGPPIGSTPEELGMPPVSETEDLFTQWCRGR